MRSCTRILAATALLLICSSSAHAAPLFGAFTRGSDLDPPSGMENGGPGSTSASILDTTYEAQAGLGGPTFTPVLKAKSVSVNAQSDDDFTQSEAEAYQVFTSSIGQTITLDIVLDGAVTNDGTPLSRSFVLADVFVIGGPDFFVSDSFCFRGERAFGVYLCGDTLGRSNQFIDGGDVTLREPLTFDVGAGEQFAVYGTLRANSRDGTSNAFDTLQMTFSDDSNLTPAIPEPSTLLLCGGGLVALALRRRSGS